MSATFYACRDSQSPLPTRLTVLRATPSPSTPSAPVWRGASDASASMTRPAVPRGASQVGGCGQHDAPAPREEVYLRRHACCWPGMAGSTPARWGCHWGTRRDQRPGTTADSTAPLAMLLLPGADLCQRKDYGAPRRYSGCGNAARPAVRYNEHDNCISLPTLEESHALCPAVARFAIIPTTTRLTRR
jgi:hypothetical protein